jgi:clan AA aspartic protease (TIGR02281 family)
MRFPPALILVGFLTSQAQADVLDAWCTQVQLPSSIALCSDPELRALTIERQHAFDAARGRVGEAQYPVLAADQSAWVVSYPKACGLAPDSPPPIPLPRQARDCMANAGRARIAYLNAYGTSNATTAPVGNAIPSASAVGPGFDCSRATAPLGRMICVSPTLSRIDLHYNQAYWALRQSLNSQGQRALDVEVSEFINSVELGCDVPEVGEISGSPDCVAAHYDAQRARWAARLTGVAAEEANRSPELHLALQRDLQAAGFLPADASIYGVYGASTRAAISAWQAARGRAVTGFVGDDDAQVLANDVATRYPPPAAPPGVTASLAPVPPTSGSTLAPITGPPLQQEEVNLKFDGGTYLVPVRINDALTLDFTIDSGASDVMIPADVMLTLTRTGTLAPSDFTGKKSYSLADGTKLPSMTLVLRELRIGHHRLQNVTASVGPVEGGMLLGQSFLSRFKSWTLDNSRHVLVLTESQ